MQTKTLVDQIDRLKTRFGDKAFDPETVRLIHREVGDMSDFGFIALVDVMISSRKHNNAPLIQDFRDARLRENKRAFDGDVVGALRTMNTPWDSGSLRRALDANPDWKGCRTAMEAVEVERLKIQIQGAK